MGSETSDGIDIDVTISVDGHELDAVQQHVVDTYESNIETFIRKNENYGSSFVNSAKIESIMKHGEVRTDELSDTIARQIFVRGFLDKLSRFYQLQFNESDDMVGEDVDDTLLDMANYSVMLVSQLRRLRDDEPNVMADNSSIWDDEYRTDFFGNSTTHNLVGTTASHDELQSRFGDTGPVWMLSEQEWTDEEIEDFVGEMESQEFDPDNDTLGSTAGRVSYEPSWARNERDDDD